MVATYTDAFDDNEKSVTSAATVAVVAAAPATPSLALALDTGRSRSDGITQNGQVNVAGLVTDATWRYSTNGGTDFTDGTDTSFTLPPNRVYPANTVQVVQTVSGTDSAAGILRAVTVDTTAPDVIPPPNRTFEATGDMTRLSQSDYGIATSSDTTVIISHTPVRDFPLGATTIPWTATDRAGNAMTANQVVTIADRTAPVISLTGANPQIIEFGGSYTELNATATDAVDDNDELTRKIVIVATAVDTSRSGDYQVTYDVTDTAGNEAVQVERSVTVAEPVANIAPVANAGADQSVAFGATVTLDGSGSSDPDGTIQSYAWTHTSTDGGAPATAIILSGGTTSGPTFTAPDTAAELVFTLTVTDDDGATNSDTVTITVTAPVADNTAPVIAIENAAVDYAENGDTAVATYTATDAESNAIAWEITGADAGLLSIGATSGLLTFNSSPDYETKSTYAVTVQATETDGDPSNLSGELAVTITVTNVDEEGAIAAITGTAQVGQTLTAGMVTDPDGGVTGITYQWQGDSTNIDSATGMTYTLTATDEGKTIRVIATYTDAFGGGNKMVTSAATGTVVAETAPRATEPHAGSGHWCLVRRWHHPKWSGECDGRSNRCHLEILHQ